MKQKPIIPLLVAFALLLFALPQHIDAQKGKVVQKRERTDYSFLVEQASSQLARTVMKTITPSSGENPSYNFNYDKISIEDGYVICYVYVFWAGKEQSWFSSRKHDLHLGGWLYIKLDGYNVTYVPKEEAEAVKKCESTDSWRKNNFKFILN